MSVPEREIPFGRAHTWRSSSLVARAANPPESPTIGGLLYPAKRTLLSGETEALKTWLALILVGCIRSLSLLSGLVIEPFVRQAYRKILPGFMMPSGSSATLMRRMRSTPSWPCSSRRKLVFP
jgi:hypothetical protein